ncbi:MAG TPA: magnesium transporter CorA family protein [Armatimonadota bacterium]|jgi:magnesium transporter
MTQLRIYKTGEGFHEETGIGKLAEYAEGEGSVVWVALQDATPEELTALETVLHLHPMTMEDLDHNEDRPRLRQYDNILSLVFFAVRGLDGADADVDFQPVNVFAGRRFIVSLVTGEMPELDEAYGRWKNNAERLPSDAGAPMYCVLDTLVDGYFPVIDRLADQVDDVEDQVIASHSATALPAIFALKKSMLRFRRVASAGRDAVNSLVVRDEVFGRDNLIFLQDVYDHIVRITDSVDTYRDLLSNAMETYLSVTSNLLAENSNKLNVTMQTLTSWSIIIGSGAVITGVYGMNVEGIPFRHGQHGFVSVMLVMFGVAIALAGLFRRKGWI